MSRGMPNARVEPGLQLLDTVQPLERRCLGRVGTGAEDHGNGRDGRNGVECGPESAHVDGDVPAAALTPV